MNGRLEKAASVAYWDKNAKWHKVWAEHNTYHSRIIDILKTFVLPGWRVLDIGAGNGVLSIPLSALGCRVTALEPSEGMRKLLEDESRRKSLTAFPIEFRKWEDMPLQEVYGYDLIVASNSLHLTEIGFTAALQKVFLAKPINAFIILEKSSLELPAKSTFQEYECFFEEHYITESSYAYHCHEDAFEHWCFRRGRLPGLSERPEIISALSHDRGHLWSKGQAKVNMYWWTKKNSARFSNKVSKEVLNVYQDIAMPFPFDDFSCFC